MINLAYVGMVMAGICMIFFWDRTCKARDDYDGEAISRYETYEILAAIIFVICLVSFIATKKPRQTDIIKTTILCNYNDANFIKGPDYKDGYFTSGDNTYMYELDNNIIKITNINNVNDTKTIPTVK